jgi:hypothetical protein
MAGDAFSSPLGYNFALTGGRQMKMTICFALLATASLLAGCAGSPIAAANNARANYESSVTDYRKCLAANPSNVNACQSQRLAMEAEERAYNNLTADVNTKLSRGFTNNVLVQQTR